MTPLFGFSKRNVFVLEIGRGQRMKSLVILTAMLGGFGSLIYQFSFWSVVGVVYLVAMALVVLIAFASRVPDKGLKYARAAELQN
jgi:hypothetical protein